MSETTTRELANVTKGINTVVQQPDKQLFEGVKIGFFLHTPFPSSEIYRYDLSRFRMEAPVF
jgi:trehalose 6-phosphate synthase